MRYISFDWIEQTFLTNQHAGVHERKTMYSDKVKSTVDNYTTASGPKPFGISEKYLQTTRS